MSSDKVLSDREKEIGQRLLDELHQLGPGELTDWNMRARTFLVFVACKNPEHILGNENGK